MKIYIVSFLFAESHGTVPMAWWFSQEHPCGHVIVVWVPETAVQHRQALREEDRVVGLWQSQDIWHHCREKVSVLNKIIYMICCTALWKNFLAWSYLPGTKFDSKLQILVHTLWIITLILHPCKYKYMYMVQIVQFQSFLIVIVLVWF